MSNLIMGQAWYLAHVSQKSAGLVITVKRLVITP